MIGRVRFAGRPVEEIVGFTLERGKLFCRSFDKRSNFLLDQPVWRNLIPRRFRGASDSCFECPGFIRVPETHFPSVEIAGKMKPRFARSHPLQDLNELLHALAIGGFVFIFRGKFPRPILLCLPGNVRVVPSMLDR